MAPDGAVERADHENNYRVQTINSREWAEEEKRKIVLIDREERSKGKYFMKRIKERWDAEYPGKARTAQNLIDNARRLKQEGWGRLGELDSRPNIEAQQQTREQSRISLEWTTEMKVVLLSLAQEERETGRGFM